MSSKNSTKKFASVMITIICLVMAGLLIFLTVKFRSDANPKADNIFVAVFKNPPTIVAEEVPNADNTEVKIVFTITCNANYDEVDISLKFLDAQKAIVSEHVISQKTLKKGETYDAEYVLTDDEIMDSETYVYEVKRFK